MKNSTKIQYAKKNINYGIFFIISVSYLLYAFGDILLPSLSEYYLLVIGLGISILSALFFYFYGLKSVISYENVLSRKHFAGMDKDGVSIYPKFLTKQENEFLKNSKSFSSEEIYKLSRKIYRKITRYQKPIYYFANISLILGIIGCFWHLTNYNSSVGEAFWVGFANIIFLSLISFSIIYFYIWRFDSVIDSLKMFIFNMDTTKTDTRNSNVVYKKILEMSQEVSSLKKNMFIPSNQNMDIENINNILSGLNGDYTKLIDEKLIHVQDKIEGLINNKSRDIQEKMDIQTNELAGEISVVKSDMSLLIKSIDNIKIQVADIPKETISKDMVLDIIKQTKEALRLPPEEHSPIFVDNDDNIEHDDLADLRSKLTETLKKNRSHFYQ